MRDIASPIPVTVLAGFLGAGKPDVLFAARVAECKHEAFVPGKASFLVTDILRDEHGHGGAEGPVMVELAATLSARHSTVGPRRCDLLRRRSPRTRSACWISTRWPSAPHRRSACKLNIPASPFAHLCRT